jgi:hypothetical protein
MDGDRGRGWREYLPRRVTFFQAIGLLLERYKHVSMLIQFQVVLVGGGLDGTTVYSCISDSGSRLSYSAIFSF